MILRIITHACRNISAIIALAHYSSVSAGFVNIPLSIYSAPGGVYKNLQKIWFSRVLRRVVSLMHVTPFRYIMLQMLDFKVSEFETNCIIVSCHTPWARLIMQWCHVNDFALIVTQNKSNHRANSIKIRGKGLKEMRYLLNHLHSGGRIIIMIDVFNSETYYSTKFLEKECNVSLLPVRLAKIANVPLITVAPELKDGIIQVNFGPRFEENMLKSDISELVQRILNYFENEIKRNPSIWSGYVRESLNKKQRLR